MTNQTPSNSVATCPFCGSDPIVEPRKGKLSASVRCGNKACGISPESVSADLAYAKARWNTRTQSTNTTGSDELDPGDPQDWADKLEELYGWTGSTWAEEQPEAYSFMCSLIGYLIAGHELALRVNAIATPDSDRVAVLTEALDIARKQIVEITCDATEKLREVGYECDPPERTYMPALDRIDAALSQPLGSQGR